MMQKATKEVKAVKHPLNDPKDGDETEENMFATGEGVDVAGQMLRLQLTSCPGLTRPVCPFAVSVGR